MMMDNSLEDNVFEDRRIILEPDVNNDNSNGFNVPGEFAVNMIVPYFDSHESDPALRESPSPHTWPKKIWNMSYSH